MRLLGVELARLRARRATGVLLLLGMIFVLVAIGTAINDRRPPGAAELAAAEAMAQEQASQPWVEEEIANCEATQAAGDDFAYGPGFDCEDMRPVAEHFLSTTPANLADDIRELFPGAGLTLALATALLGATFAGADWSAGTMGTHLVFEPRRGRVFASKAGAIALAGAVPAALTLGVGFLAVWITASAWGTTDLADAETPTTGAGLWWLAVRAAIFVSGAGVGGYLLAMAFRSSLAAVGTVTAYGFLGEGLLRSFWDGAGAWVLSTRSTAWLFGGTELYAYPENCFSEEPCVPTVTRITTAGGGIYLAVLLGLGLLLSYAVFRRRDVT